MDNMVDKLIADAETDLIDLLLVRNFDTFAMFDPLNVSTYMCTYTHACELYCTVAASRCIFYSASSACTTHLLIGMHNFARTSILRTHANAHKVTHTR